MKKQNRIALLILIVIFMIGAAGAQIPGRTIAVVLDEVGQDKPDFHLAEKLHRSITMDAGMTVIVPENDSTFPDISEFRYDGSRLFQWGREAGCRFIVHLQIDDRRIVTSKRPSIPYVLNRYAVEGRLCGMYRLMDLNRGKVIGSWKLNTRITGTEQYQLGENYPGDPDLHLSAMRKMTLLDELDEKAAEEIMLNIRPNVRGR